MAAFFECGIVDLELGYWSSALKGGFGANFSICVAGLAQEVALVKFGDQWSLEALSNLTQGD